MYLAGMNFQTHSSLYSQKFHKFKF
ncbi:DUF6783 domain-containing protein [uncultured Clostridium sp.]